MFRSYSDSYISYWFVNFAQALFVSIIQALQFFQLAFMPL